MMAKVKSKRDLPKWFNIENYDSFRELSQPEILNQIQCRAKLIMQVNNTLNEHTPPCVIDDLKGGYLWHTVTKGSPLIKSSIELENNHNDMDWLGKIGINVKELNLLGIQHSLAIKGVSASKILSIGLEIDRLDLVKPLSEDSPLKGILKLYPLGFHKIDINKLKPALRCMQDISEVFVDINIADYSDEEILMQLSALLPVWRQETGLHCPKKNGLSKVSIYKKTLDYQVIACIDLYIWQIFHKLKIPNRVLTVALFPNGEKGEKELTDTVLPFVNKMLNLVER